MNVSIQILSHNKPIHAATAVYSVLASPPSCDYQILVYEGGTNPENYSRFTNALAASEREKVIYLEGPNYGFGRAYNLMGKFSETYVRTSTHYICLNEDMFFGPEAIDCLTENAHKGLVCCNLTNGGYYNPKLPSRLHVDLFNEANKSHHPNSGFGSNPPFCLDKWLWDKLSVFGKSPGMFSGPFDEDIDPSPVGWHTDWDLFNRVLLCRSNTLIFEQAPAYHYDHLSGVVLDRTFPGWTECSTRNYAAKYGITGRKLDHESVRKDWYQISESKIHEVLLGAKLETVEAPWVKSSAPLKLKASFFGDELRDFTL